MVLRDWNYSIAVTPYSDHISRVPSPPLYSSLHTYIHTYIHTFNFKNINIMVNVINHSQPSMFSMSSLSNSQDNGDLLIHITIVTNSQVPSPDSQKTTYQKLYKEELKQTQSATTISICLLS